MSTLHAPAAHAPHQAPAAADIDWTQLPSPCRLAIARYLDATSRAAWRLTHRQACSDVWDATRSAKWPFSDTSSHVGGWPELRRSEPYESLTPLHTKCPGLHTLDCTHMTKLLSLHGLPTALHTLNLHSAKIPDLSPLEACTQLQALALHSPAAAALAPAFPPVLSTLSTLTSLGLLNCRWTQDTIAALAPAIGALSNLRHLDLATTERSWTLRGEGAATLAPALSSLSLLQHLQLDGQDIGLDGVEALAPALSRLSCLTALRLSRNDIQYDCLPPLGVALMALPSLALLDLSDNDLADDGGEALAAALSPLGPSLHTLHLQRAGIKVNSVRGLARALRACTHLRTLDLAENAIAPAATPELASALSAMPHLEALGLWASPLGAGGLATLAPALGPPKRLAKLDLTNTKLEGVEGAASLVPVLAAQTGLTHLELRSNSLGDAGMALLAPLLLPLGASLQLLWLGRTGLGAKGASALVPVLPTLTSLTNLSLAGNWMGPAAAAALAPALRPLGPSLRALSLRENSVGLAGVQALSEVVPELQALTLFDLLGGSYDDWPNSDREQCRALLGEAAGRVPGLKGSLRFYGYGGAGGQPGPRFRVGAVTYAATLVPVQRTAN